MSARRIPLPESSEYPGSEISGEVFEFVRAMAAYQKKYARRFPSWSEALYVLRTLGYAKRVPGAVWTEPQPELTTETQRHGEDEDKPSSSD